MSVKNEFGDFVHSEETGEDYEVIGTLGSGGFGAVWESTDSP